MITEDERALMLAQAHRRRVALIHYGCSTYRLGVTAGGNEMSIVCLCCGLQSFGSEDVFNRYCGFCHCYHSDWVFPLEES